jgi:hypothetical protein
MSENAQNQGSASKANKKRRNRKKKHAKHEKKDELALIAGLSEADAAQLEREVTELDDESLASEDILQAVAWGTRLFLMNEFTRAEKFLEKSVKVSVYHALGHATIWFVRAVMTFEREDMERAIELLNETHERANRTRRKIGFFKGMFSRASEFRQMSKSEIHSELICAETLLLKSILGFFKDESVSSFLRAGLDIRNSYSTYKTCWNVLNDEGNEHSHDANFQAGVYLGIGAFNMCISLLPPKFMKVLELIGFSGDLKLGLELLEKGGECEPEQCHTRGPLCILEVLFYHVFLAPMFDLPDGDVSKAELITTRALAEHPNSIMFQFFLGKVEQCKGHVDESIVAFEKALEFAIDPMWEKLSHIVSWELVWCFVSTRDWQSACAASSLLLEKSNWSKVAYAYQVAAFKFAMDGATEEVVQLLKDLPSNKLKLAGKSVPIEKFLLRKARKFEAQDNWLFLPAIELLYIWQGLGKLGVYTKPMLDLINNEYNTSVASKKHEYEYRSDDTCMTLLFKGVLLMQLGKLKHARKSFVSLFEMESEIKLDHWIAPYARCEFARLLSREGELDEAKRQLTLAAKKYKHYSNESRLHFRLHYELTKLNAPALEE